jgi:hypothetical protein
LTSRASPGASGNANRLASADAVRTASGCDGRGASGPQVPSTQGIFTASPDKTLATDRK